MHWKCLDHIAALGLTATTGCSWSGPLYHVGAFDLPGLALLLVGGIAGGDARVRARRGAGADRARAPDRRPGWRR
jgi:hypothetical protein